MIKISTNPISDETFPPKWLDIHTWKYFAFSYRLHLAASLNSKSIWKEEAFDILNEMWCCAFQYLNCKKIVQKKKKGREWKRGKKESGERKCFKVIRVHKRFPEKMKWIYCYLSNTKATICQYWLWLWWIPLIRSTLYVGEENQTRNPKPS